MDGRIGGTNEVSRAVVRIQAGVLAVVGATLGGLGMFVMTAWLVIKDGPNVGAHLQLLGHYFIGYTVTWSGSIIGFFYGALTGGAIAWIIAAIYNLVVNLRSRTNRKSVASAAKS